MYGAVLCGCLMLKCISWRGAFSDANLDDLFFYPFEGKRPVRVEVRFFCKYGTEDIRSHDMEGVTFIGVFAINHTLERNVIFSCLIVSFCVNLTDRLANYAADHYFFKAYLFNSCHYHLFLGCCSYSSRRHKLRLPFDHNLTAGLYIHYRTHLLRWWHPFTKDGQSCNGKETICFKLGKNISGSNIKFINIERG